MKITWFTKYIPIISLLALSLNANAGLITQTLGNGASGLSDGDIANFATTIFPIQQGQIAPFTGAIGHEIITESDNTNWLFNYGPITDTIVSATFSFGIWDHDSAASGSQLDAFALDGINLTTELNTLFEAGGGALDRQYKIYSFTLDSSFFTQLADGLFSVDLNIGGKGLLTNGLTQEVSESNFNAYHLIYSSLTINTDNSTTPPTNVPEPATLMLLVLALVGFRKRIFS